MDTFTIRSVLINGSSVAVDVLFAKPTSGRAFSDQLLSVKARRKLVKVLLVQEQFPCLAEEMRRKGMVIEVSDESV